MQDIQHLESVQKLALRVSSKQWDLGYSELLDTCNLPTLENQRLYMKLCHLFKIAHGLCYFPPGIFLPKTNPSHCFRPYTLQQPFARTNAFYSSFIPDSIRYWNYVLEDLVCAPTYINFKNSLRVLLGRSIFSLSLGWRPSDSGGWKASSEKDPHHATLPFCDLCLCMLYAVVFRRMRNRVSLSMI